MAIALLAASGCARPDWIESTLVTADVTDVWPGTVVGGSFSYAVEEGRGDNRRGKWDRLHERQGPALTTA